VEDAEHAQPSAQAPGVATQVLKGLGGGGEEDVQAGDGMGAEPLAQRFGEGKGRDAANGCEPAS
jgi:hypothetical protein